METGQDGDKPPTPRLAKSAQILHNLPVGIRHWLPSAHRLHRRHWNVRTLHQAYGLWVHRKEGGRLRQPEVRHLRSTRLRPGIRRTSQPLRLPAKGSQGGERHRPVHQRNARTLLCPGGGRLQRQRRIRHGRLRLRTAARDRLLLPQENQPKEKLGLGTDMGRERHSHRPPEACGTAEN